MTIIEEQEVCEAYFSHGAGKALQLIRKFNPRSTPSEANKMLQEILLRNGPKPEEHTALKGLLNAEADLAAQELELIDPISLAHLKRLVECQQIDLRALTPMTGEDVANEIARILSSMTNLLRAGIIPTAMLERYAGSTCFEPAEMATFYQVNKRKMDLLFLLVKGM